MQLRKMKGSALFFFFCLCLLSVSAQRICNQEEYNRQLIAEMPSMQKKMSEVEALTLTQRSLNVNSSKPPLPAFSTSSESSTPAPAGTPDSVPARHG